MLTRAAPLGNGVEVGNGACVSRATRETTRCTNGSAVGVGAEGGTPAGVDGGGAPAGVGNGVPVQEAIPALLRCAEDDNEYVVTFVLDADSAEEARGEARAAVGAGLQNLGLADLEFFSASVEEVK